MSPSSSGVSSLGSSWNTPPFPLPSDSPVSALLELSGDYTPEKSSDSDEGIVSDHSYEYEEEMRKKVNTEPINQSIYLFLFKCHVQ